MEHREYDDSSAENNINENNNRKRKPSSAEICETNGSARKQPVVLKDMDDLIHHLELMHDRCITRNLQAAGLGGLDANQEKLIYGHLDPNAEMITGESLLTAVILYIKEAEKQFRYSTILLNEGADPNKVDKDGKTALMHACLLGLEKPTKTILQNATTDITKKDNVGNTALMYAAATGREKIIKMYIKSLRKLEKRVRKKSVTKQNDPVENNNFEYLLNEDVLEDKNERGYTAKDLALQNDHYECAEILESEQSRRLKVLQQKLLSLSNKNRRSSVTVQSAKESLKKYQRNFGSFDGIFDSVDDKSEDELVGGRSTNFSRKSYKMAIAASQSIPNLQNTFLRPGHENSEEPSNGSPPSSKQQQQQQTPNLDKVPGWEEVFPRSKIITRPSSNHLETNSPEIKDRLHKSLTESSISSHSSTNGVVQKKSSITQRLVNMLRRRNKHSVVSNPMDSIRPPSELQLRKGLSQPDLLRKMSKDSTSSATFPQRIINAVERHRKSIDLSIGKQVVHQNYSNFPNPNDNNSTKYDEKPTTSHAFDSRLDESLNFNQSIRSIPTLLPPNDHSPLKPKSSLPALPKKTLTNKQLPIYNESILDREIFNMPSSSRNQKGRASFDDFSFK